MAQRMEQDTICIMDVSADRFRASGLGMTPRIINNNLVVPTDNPGQLRALFPQIKEATVQGQTFCAVPHTLGAARVLNNIGIPAPSPILTQYDWPGRYTPRWYQLETAAFFTIYMRCYCHNSMRTGKTLSALWAADYLRRSGNIQRTMIVAPLSTIYDVWQQNIFESFPLRTFNVIYGSRQKRLDLLAQPCDFYVVNHHGVGLIEKALADRPDINHFIIDECATHRNARNRRTKEKKGGVLWAPLNEVLNNQGIVRSAWGMTGTPTPNDPTDAFGQCKLITPENYSGHFTSFKQETMMQLTQFKWVPKKTAAASVARILRPSIRFERSVCTDMEPCLIDRRAELSAEQATAYKQLVNQAMTELNGQVITAVNAAVLLGKLIQTSAGVCRGVDGNLVHFDFGPRYSVLEELIEENDEKVLVFVPFTGVLDALAEKLRKRWSVAVVDGGVSINARTKIFREFRTLKDPHVLVCHPKVMAHGLDLTAASLAIWYAPHMNAEDFQQANARIDGSKQKVKIDIARIYATAEEKRAYSVIDGKDNFQSVVLDLTRKGKF